MNTVADIRSLEREEGAFASALPCAGSGLKAPSRARAVWDNRLLRFALISLLIHGVVLIAAFVFFVGSPDSGSGQSFIVVQISGFSGGGGSGGTGKAVGVGLSSKALGVVKNRAAPVVTVHKRVVRNRAAPVVSGTKIKATKIKASAVVVSKIAASKIERARPVKKASSSVGTAGVRKVTIASTRPAKPAPTAEIAKRASEEAVSLVRGVAAVEMPSFAAEQTLGPVNTGETYFSVADDNLSTGVQASTVGRGEVSDVSFELPSGPSAGLGATGATGEAGAGQGGGGGSAGRGAMMRGLKAPSYPPFSRLKGEEGTVKLRVKVGADGRQTEVMLQRSSGYARLDRAAIKAIKRARFIPAMSYGRPVPSTKTVAFVFKLKD